MYSECETEPEVNEFGDVGAIAVDETLELESIELSAPTDLPAVSAGQREQMQRFLVACFQACVSIETMSRYLGIDANTIRSELRHGIEAWNANRSRTRGAGPKRQLTVAAPRA